MTFIQPQWLWLLPLVIGVYTGAVVWFHYRRRVIMGRLVHQSRLDESTLSLSAWREKSREVIYGLALCCLVVALARPSLGEREERIPQFGTDILFLLDARPHMLAEDFRPNRWDQSRLLIERTLDQLGGNRSGLIVLGDQAFLESPLSLDRGALRQAIASLDPESLGTGSGSLNDLLEEMTAVLFGEARRSPQQKVVVLLSPGEPGWDPSPWLRRWERQGITLHAIGTATQAGTLIRDPSLVGGGFRRDDTGAPRLFRLERQGLESLAMGTGGEFRTLEEVTRSGLPESWVGFRPIDQPGDGWGVRLVPLEHFPYPLALAAILLMLEMIIRRTPRPLTGQKGRGIAVIVILGSFLFLTTEQSLHAEQPVRSPRDHFLEGTNAFERNDWETAADSFRRALRGTPPKRQRDILYNLGHVYFQKGASALESNPNAVRELWEDALRFFRASLEIDPGDEDSHYNAKLIEELLENLPEPPPQEDQEDSGDNDDGGEDEESGEGEEGEGGDESQQNNEADSEGSEQSDQIDQTDQSDQTDETDEMDQTDQSEDNAREAESETENQSPAEEEEIPVGEAEVDPNAIPEEEAIVILRSLEGVERRLPFARPQTSPSPTPRDRR